MFNFFGGLFLGILIGLAAGAIFLKDNIIEIQKLDDEKTNELLKILDLAEGEKNGI
jgi:hypothetical protein